MSIGEVKSKRFAHIAGRIRQTFKIMTRHAVQNKV